MREMIAKEDNEKFQGCQEAMGNGEKLPDSWAWSYIGDVTLPVEKIDPSLRPDCEITYLDISSIDNNANRIIEAKSYLGKEAPSRARQLVAKDDILFSTVTTYLKNIAQVPEKYNNQIASTGFSVLRPAKGIKPNYLFFYSFSKGFLDKIENFQRGTIYPAVRDKDVRAQAIPIPPPEEQQRIVAKLEELLSELDKGIESFKTAREQLAVYRQAVLKHAFEGKLTEEWRKKHAGELEPAETVLKKIKAEREQRCQQQLDKWKLAVKAWESSGKEGKKPTKPGKPKELPPLTEEELAGLPELPEGWGWIRLGTVIDEPKYGTSKKCSYKSSGVGVLRIPNIVGGSINTEDLKYAIFDDDEKDTYSLEEGDLLFVRSNGSVSLVGQTALVKGNDTEYLYAGYLIRIRSNKNVLDDKYLNFLFTAHMLRSQIESKSKSTTGVNNINSRELQSLTNSICSVIEQQEIVKQIEFRLSVTEKLEQNIEDGLKQAETLRQSLLKKAFEGKLVAQDPNDEPASVLLARIKLEKAGLKQKAQKKKKAAV